MTETDTTTNPDIEADTLRGDLRDMILDEFKHMAKPWQQMSEDEQSRVIFRARDIADICVRSSIDLIAARGLPALPIQVGKITVDGSECKGAFEFFADDENLLRIRHLQGARAMFVLASPDAYAGERKPAKADPDEPELPVGEQAEQRRADEAQLAKLMNSPAAKRTAKAIKEGRLTVDLNPSASPAADPLDIPPHLDRRKKASA